MEKMEHPKVEQEPHQHQPVIMNAAQIREEIPGWPAAWGYFPATDQLVMPGIPVRLFYTPPSNNGNDTAPAQSAAWTDTPVVGATSSAPARPSSTNLKLAARVVANRTRGLQSKPRSTTAPRQTLPARSPQGHPPILIASYYFDSILHDLEKPQAHQQPLPEAETRVARIPRHDELPAPKPAGKATPVKETAANDDTVSPVRGEVLRMMMEAALLPDAS